MAFRTNFSPLIRTASNTIKNGSAGGSKGFASLNLRALATFSAAFIVVFRIGVAGREIMKNRCQENVYSLLQLVSYLILFGCVCSIF